MQSINKSQKGFTLLELLVVVGIIAIIGGAAISSLGGQEGKAARGAATGTIASVESAFRIYKAGTGNIPNNLESLVCMPATAATDQTGLAINNGPAAETVDAAQVYKFGGTSNASGIGGGLGRKVAEKFDLVAIPAAGIAALNDVGVTELRYADTAACDNPTVETTATINGEDVVGALQDMDIPAHAFEDPRPGSKNRGRGFSAVIAEDAPMMVWNKGENGYNNVKVGADADAILVGLGVGQLSDLVGNGPDAAFAKAPFYGQVGKDKYAHYIALVNIGTDADPWVSGTSNGGLLDATTAPSFLAEGDVFVQAVVDARGDFLDEEMAEFQGQKL
jgi:prepilin-type N-terminal cleavage/methylation domain-containing protein